MIYENEKENLIQKYWKEEEYKKNISTIDTNTLQLIDQVYKSNRLNSNISKDDLNMQNSLARKISSKVYTFSYDNDKIENLEYYSPCVNERNKLEIRKKFHNNQYKNNINYNLEKEITNFKQTKQMQNFSENISEYFTIITLLNSIKFKNENYDEFEIVNSEKINISREFLLKYLTSEFASNLMRNRTDLINVIEKIKKIRDKEFTDLMKDNTNFKYHVEDYEIIDSEMLEDLEDEEDVDLMADIHDGYDDEYDDEIEFESDDFS